jgi:hypothetical protein
VGRRAARAGGPGRRAGPAAITIAYVGALPPAAVPGAGTRPGVAVGEPLGAQFLAWQYAAAPAARLRGTDLPSVN